jgi:hypothetical protein
MTYQKSTRLLVNLALILLVLILLKSLLSFPRSLYAAQDVEYKVVKYNKTEYVWNEEGLSRFLNANAKQGWRYHSMHWGEASGQIFGIFER